MEFLIRDRLGQLRFLGLGSGGATRLVFRERLTRAIFQRRASPPRGSQIVAWSLRRGSGCVRRKSTP